MTRSPIPVRTSSLEVAAEVPAAAEVAPEVAAGVAEPAAAPVAGAPVAAVVVVAEEQATEQETAEPGAERAHPAAPTAPATAVAASPAAAPAPAVAAAVAAVAGLLRPLADVSLRHLEGVLRQSVGVARLAQGGGGIVARHALRGVEVPLRLGEPRARLGTDGPAPRADEVRSRRDGGPRGQQRLVQQLGRAAGLRLRVPRHPQRPLQCEGAGLQLPPRRDGGAGGPPGGAPGGGRGGGGPPRP